MPGNDHRSSLEYFYTVGVISDRASYLSLATATFKGFPVITIVGPDLIHGDCGLENRLVTQKPG